MGRQRISKITEFDRNVKNTLKAPILLAETFEKTKTQIQGTQDSLTNKITNT